MCSRIWGDFGLDAMMDNKYSCLKAPITSIAADYSAEHLTKNLIELTVLPDALLSPWPNTNNPRL